MGQDKALLPFGDKKTLSQYQYDRLKVHFKEVFISSKYDKFDFLVDKNFLILDEGEVFSPIIALKTVVDKLNVNKFFLITVDTPMISTNSIDKLISISKSYDITVAKTEKTHSLCGVFSKNIKDTINEMLQKDIHKVGYLINNSKSNIVTFDDDKEFVNLNYEKEYIDLKKSI